jgi:hypothetical protein
MESRQINPWRQFFSEAAAPNESFIRLAKLNSNFWSELPLYRVALPPVETKKRQAGKSSIVRLVCI